MTVHPQIAEALKKLEEANIPPIEEMSVEAARDFIRAMSAARAGEPEPIAKVENRAIPGPAGDIPVRIYWPEGGAPAGGMVYYHGGGHVIGDLDTHDKVAQNLTAYGNMVTVSVDYRMGPEDPFPAAVEDSWAAVLWTHANADALGFDSGKLAVAGDSAGGNLAGVMALMARDAGGPALSLQALIYPVGDYHLVGESYDTYGAGYGVLTSGAMGWFRDRYLSKPEDAADWRASPLQAKDFSGVAPAIIIAAGCDVLHDDGVRYRDALEAAGVTTEYVNYPGMIHAFFGMTPDIDDAVTAQKKVGAALQAAFR